jgi:hypothetical protein
VAVNGLPILGILVEGTLAGDTGEVLGGALGVPDTWVILALGKISISSC